MKRIQGIGTAMILALAAASWCGPAPSEAALRSPGMEPVSDESAGENPPDYGERLRDELQGLIEELKGLEQDVWEKIQKDVIPLIREEIRKLREKLEEHYPDKEPSEEEPPSPRQI